ILAGIVIADYYLPYICCEDDIDEENADVNSIYEQGDKFFPVEISPVMDESSDQEQEPSKKESEETEKQQDISKLENLYKCRGFIDGTPCQVEVQLSKSEVKSGSWKCP